MFHDISAVVGAVLGTLGCCTSLLSAAISALALAIGLQDELSPTIRLSVQNRSFSVIQAPATLGILVRNLGKRAVSDVVLGLTPDTSGSDPPSRSISVGSLAPLEDCVVDLGPDIEVCLKSVGELRYTEFGPLLTDPRDLAFALLVRCRTSMGRFARVAENKHRLLLIWRGSETRDSWDVELSG